MGKKIILTADIKEKATTKFGPFDPTTTLLLYALIIILGFEFVKGVRGKFFNFFLRILKKYAYFRLQQQEFLSDITDKNLKSQKISVISDRIPKSGKVSVIPDKISKSEKVSVISDKIPNIKNR